MEEVKKTEQETNYIKLSQDSNNVGNIFNELSGELGELDFAERSTEKEIEKKNYFLIADSITGKIFVLTIIVTILLTIDVFVRSMNDNSLFANLPICGYLSFGVDNYENTDCKTLSMIATEIGAEKEKLEKNIITNLILLVPKLMQSSDISSSPKVQFIQEHTGDSRVSITEAINRFIEIKNRTNYQWEDIECQSLLMDEKWKITVSCQIYGGALITPAWVSTKTSRDTTLSFLERLDDAKSGFQILSYPKVLNISEFNSADGFKAVFSTQTSLDLKLQYLPANKM